MSRRPHQTLRLPLRVDNEKALGRTAVRPYVSPVKLAESNLYHYLPTAPAIFDQTQANQPALCYDFQSHHGRTGMFSKIHHAGYHVEDIDAAVAWYEKTFGGVRTGGGTAAAGKLAFVRMWNAEVELIEPVDRSKLTGRGDHVLDHLGYVVDDLDKAVADYKAKGYKFATEEPWNNAAGYRLIFFDTSDTNGTRIHLTEAGSMGW